MLKPVSSPTLSLLSRTVAEEPLFDLALRTRRESLKVPESYLRIFEFRRKLYSGELDFRNLNQFYLTEILTPVVCTCGPRGPNCARKMITFSVRESLLEETVKELKLHVKKPWEESREFMLKKVYHLDRVDLLKLVAQEMFMGNTWENIRSTGRASILITTSPEETIELRCRVKIDESGLYYEYCNLLHDLYHRDSHGWKPVYVFEVDEIIEKSYKKK